VIQERALTSSVQTTVELPSGTKVVVNPNPKQTKKHLKRALATYSDDHVIENVDDCTDRNVVKKKFKTNKGGERELPADSLHN
jgi:hypothetical protein